MKDQLNFTKTTFG